MWHPIVAQTDCQQSNCLNKSAHVSCAYQLQTRTDTCTGYAWAAQSNSTYDLHCLEASACCDLVGRTVLPRNSSNTRISSGCGAMRSCPFHMHLWQTTRRTCCYSGAIGASSPRSSRVCQTRAAQISLYHSSSWHHLTMNALPWLLTR